MVHVYYGDGKGKTTAAMGQAMRASGAGWRVVVVQFLKDGTSSEVGLLQALPGVVAALHDGAQAKFSFRMNAQEKAASRALHDANLRRALELVEGRGTVGEQARPREEDDVASLREARLPQGSLLVLDEVVDALGADLLDEGLLGRAVAWAEGAASREVVITGHALPGPLAAKADYLTRFTCERHPYQRGVGARLGVEY